MIYKTAEQFEELTLAELKEVALENKLDEKLQKVRSKAPIVQALVEGEIEVEVEDVDTDDEDNKGDGKAPKADGYFYYFKGNAYVDDNPAESTKLLRSGLYRFDKPLKRFEGKKLDTRFITDFGGVPNEADIVELASKVGVEVPRGKNIDFNELLYKLTSPVDFVDY